MFKKNRTRILKVVQRISLSAVLSVMLMLLLSCSLTYAADETASVGKQYESASSKKNGWNKSRTKYYKNGKFLTGLKKITKNGKSNWYLFDKKTGKIKTGFQYIKSKNITCYFSSKNGKMLTGKIRIHKRPYKFNKKTGALLGVNEKVDKLANLRLNKADRKLRQAYEWSRTFPYVHFTAQRSLGIGYYANFGFKNGYGNCYVKAATFVAMARQLGYQARQLGGYVNNASPHSWVEIYYKGKWRICDPSFGRAFGNGWMTYYGAPGTWRYYGGQYMDN